jgi:RNA polymerase sigma factor (sigma-70 family)
MRSTGNDADIRAAEDGLRSGAADFAKRVRFNQRQLRSDLKPRYDFIVCGSGFRQHLCSLSLRECARRIPREAFIKEQRVDVVAVHEALDRLAELNERQSQVMTLRYFGGMTVPETALALGISVVTVERDWRLARAWLAGQLRGTG